jgi:hypothetical protein
MAAYQKPQAFVEYLAEGVFNLASDTLKVFLSNDTFSPSADAVKADMTEVSGGNGYTSGGNAVTVTSSSQTSGTYKLVLGDPATWTASGGSIGPFKTAVLYKVGGTSPANPIIAAWDYGSSITLAPGESFAVDFDPTTGVLTLA